MGSSPAERATSQFRAQHGRVAAGLGVLGDCLVDGTPTAPVHERHLPFLTGALECLSVRERTIIELRFGLSGGEPHTLEAVGARSGLSHERVRQIQVAALRRLRTALMELAERSRP